jgi:hypothetical protein
MTTTAVATVLPVPIEATRTTAIAEALIQGFRARFATVHEVRIETDEEQRAVAELRVDAVKAIGAIEATRKAMVGPHNDLVHAVNDIAKGASGALEIWRDAFGRAIAARQRRLELEAQEAERRRLEETRRLADQAANAEREAALLRQASQTATRQAETAEDLPAFMEATERAEEAGAAADTAVLNAARARQEAANLPRTPSPGRTFATGPIKTSVRQVWKFEVASPSDVPREFLKVDESLIRAAVNRGVREIPGVRIFAEDQVAQRRVEDSS